MVVFIPDIINAHVYIVVIHDNCTDHFTLLFLSFNHLSLALETKTFVFLYFTHDTYWTHFVLL